MLGSGILQTSLFTTMTLLKRLGLILPASLFAATLLIAGCSKSSTQAGLEKEDLDGDGIADIYDPDIDGDGIPNGSDPDIDGDGIPNGKDPSPGTSTPNYCDSIQVFGLNEEDTTGSEIELTWKLTSSKTGGDCVVKETVASALVREHASAAGAATTDSEPTNPLLNTTAKIEIPAACTGAFVEVTYDFTEIATLIKADPNAPGWIVKQRHKADPERCDLDGDGSPDFGARCSFTNANIKDAVNDYIAGGGEGEYMEGSSYANCGLIGTWDVSGVTDMSGLFREKATFNEDISGWNVSNVENMTSMFFGASSFNQPIGDWNVSNVTHMGSMFNGASSFNQPIGDWNVSKVTDMFYMFRGASSFNQTIGDWNVSKVTEMRYLFFVASSFFQNISSWCVSEIKSQPQSFDSGSGFQGFTALQPQWGQPCDGSFVAASSDDLDNDGIPNGSDPDVDGDGIPNTSDKDIDGDGIENKNDPDIDGDGIKNGIDKDSDGDGTPDAEDETPGGPS